MPTRTNAVRRRPDELHHEQADEDDRAAGVAERSRQAPRARAAGSASAREVATREPACRRARRPAPPASTYRTTSIALIIIAGCWIAAAIDWTRSSTRVARRGRRRGDAVDAARADVSAAPAIARPAAAIVRDALGAALARALERRTAGDDRDRPRRLADAASPKRRRSPTTSASCRGRATLVAEPAREWPAATRRRRGMRRRSTRACVAVSVGRSAAISCRRRSTSSSASSAARIGPATAVARRRCRDRRAATRRSRRAGVGAADGLRRHRPPAVLDARRGADAVRAPHVSRDARPPTLDRVNCDARARAVPARGAARRRRVPRAPR